MTSHFNERMFDLLATPEQKREHEQRKENTAAFMRSIPKECPECHQVVGHDAAKTYRLFLEQIEQHLEYGRQNDALQTARKALGTE